MSKAIMEGRSREALSECLHWLSKITQVPGWSGILNIRYVREVEGASELATPTAPSHSL